MSYEIHLGNAIEFMQTMRPDSVQAICTDPPYGTQELGGGYGRRQLWDKGDGNSRVIEGDLDLSLIEAAYPHFARLMPVGWAAVFFAPRKTPQFIEATSSEDWYGSVVWDKGAPGLGYTIRYAHEDIGIFRIGEPERPEQPLMSVIRYAKLANYHPHEKPVALLKRLIAWSTKPGDTVFDPFAGSGSTAIACIQLGRNFIGCEIDPEHYATAQKRIAEATAQPMLFAVTA